MKRSKTLTLLGSALLMVLLAFGLPTLIVLSLGHRHSISLGRWLGAKPPAPAHGHPIGREVPQFSLTDQRGFSITRDSLEGRIWVASFFFSRCAGTCPMTSAKMARLQRQVSGSDVQLVSFSMDPGFDTPQVLQAYAKQFQVDDDRWHMLTGERQQITNIVDGLGLADPNRGEMSNTMIHSDQFVLIDRQGRTRGFYNSSDEPALRHLAADAMLLARRSMN